MDRLIIGDNKRYLYAGTKPFFWLGDTAWLLFSNITEEEAYTYLKNRAEKGYNVIQAVLVYATDGLKDINKMTVKCCDVESTAYWEHCDRIIEMAKELDLYMALLPSWGSLVKREIITVKNVQTYAEFLANRYGNKENVIWVLGGDVKADGFENVYHTFGKTLKAETKNQLITFHPFGRNSSSKWFADEEWLDFNMFQSGHRRYDQGDLGAWDDNAVSEGFYGEDSWRYVIRDHKLSNKPTLDGEPSYEWILQGLHDITQPYWVAKDVRRYAYWSVFAGACGHTYGHNSVMQFFDKNIGGVSYGAKDSWKVAIHHDGAGQMGYLKNLMMSVDFTTGTMRDDLLLDGQNGQHDRIAVFAGSEFIFAYNYNANVCRLNLEDYVGKDMYYFRPSTGIYSYMGKVKNKEYTWEPIAVFDGEQDCVLVVK